MMYQMFKRDYAMQLIRKCTDQIEARRSVVVKALFYKPEGNGFENPWGDFLNLPNPSGLTRPWGSLSL
jgi:hypothetical protein